MSIYKPGTNQYNDPSELGEIIEGVPDVGRAEKAKYTTNGIAQEISLEAILRASSVICGEGGEELTFQKEDRVPDGENSEEVGASNDLSQVDRS